MFHKHTCHSHFIRCSAVNKGHAVLSKNGSLSLVRHFSATVTTISGVWGTSGTKDHLSLKITLLIIMNTLSTSSLSLARAATSIIFVATKVFSQQTWVCHGKTPLGMTKVCLSQKTLPWCDENMFVATKLLLQQIFVTTSMCLLWQKWYLHNFVTTKAVFCCDKHVFVSKNICCD